MINISKIPKRYLEILQKYIDIDWECLIESENDLSEDFIDYFKYDLDFDKLIQTNELSESFIEKYYDKFDPDMLLKSQKLSEEFIIKHLDDFDMIDVLLHQKLSEKAIMDNINKLNSYYLYYILRNNFIKDQDNLKLLKLKIM